MTAILTAIGAVFIILCVIDPFASFFIDIIDKLGMHIGDRHGLKESVKTPVPEQTVAIGANGRTLTNLRPSGIAHIEGNRCDVIAKDKCIDKDEDIQVCRVEGNRIYVERKQEPTTILFQKVEYNFVKRIRHTFAVKIPSTISPGLLNPLAYTSACNRGGYAAHGYLALLHTWTQRLQEHFHLHCLVPSGVWREAAGEWKP